MQEELKAKVEELDKKADHIKNNMVHKEIMAQEVYNELKRSKSIALIAVAGIFLTYSITILAPIKYGVYAGLASALTFIGAYSFALYKIITTMNRIKTDYKIQK